MKYITIFGTKEDAIQYSIEHNLNYSNVICIDNLSKLLAIDNIDDFYIIKIDIGIVGYLYTFGEHYTIVDYIKNFKTNK